MSKVRPWRGGAFVLAVCGAVALGGAGGCSSNRPTSQATTKPVGKPIFDGRRGGGSFPLEAKTLPVSPAELTGAIELGYRKRMTGPATQSFATVIRSRNADTLDQIDELSADVSEWTVKKDFRPTQLGKGAVVEKTFRVKKLRYSADPLKYEPGRLSVRLEAEDAEMVILRDKDGVRALVMAGAKRGEVRFWTRMDELERATEAGMKKGTEGTGLRITALKLDFKSPSPRQLDINVGLTGSWLFLPMRLKIVGRMEVDAEMFAQFANMGATGEGPAGELLGPFVDEAMKKQEEKRSPLMVFRDGKTKATDFTVTTGEVLEMTFKFSRE